MERRLVSGLHGGSPFPSAVEYGPFSSKCEQTPFQAGNGTLGAQPWKATSFGSARVRQRAERRKPRPSSPSQEGIPARKPCVQTRRASSRVEKEPEPGIALADMFVRRLLSKNSSLCQQSN